MKNQIVDRMEEYHANVQPLEDPAFGNALLVKTVGDGFGGNVPVQIGDGTGNVMILEPNGSIPVTLQDQTSPAIMSPLFRTVDEITITVDALLEAIEITVSDATNIVARSHLVLTNPTTGAFHFCDAIGAPVGNVVQLDTPCPFPFGIGSFVTVGEHDIGTALGTRAAPVLFHARVNNGSPVAFDVTRIMLLCKTASVGDLSEFGDLPRLINGLIVRKKNIDGTFQNVFNVKDNGDMKGLMFDFDILAASNPVQGQNGFAGRLTFAGQNKMGVTIRLEEGTDLEVLVQDDLTGLEAFTIIAEGSVVI